MTYIKEVNANVEQTTVFGEILTGELTPILQGTFEYTVSNSRRLEWKTNTASTITQADGMAVLTSGTTAGGYALLRSKNHAKYKSGFGGNSRFTTLFTAGNANNNQLLGIADQLSDVAAKGSVTLTGGASGSVDSITVNGVTITSGAVAFNTSLTETAYDVAANINAYTSSPNYTAYNEGPVIYIISDALGTTPNGYAVVSSTTTITSTDANMANGADGTTIFKNGYMIGYIGTTFGFHRFQNDTVTTVAIAAWDDPLDGTGASGMTIDLTKLNVWQIRFQYLGAGAVELWVEDDSTGKFVKVHTVLYANNNIVPSVYNPNFHHTLYVDSASTNSVVMKSASYAYFVEGRVKLQQIDQPQFSTNIVSLGSVTTEVALFTIRNKETYQSKDNFIAILLENIVCSIEAGAANNLGQFRLLKNAVLGGTPSWGDINTSDSVVEIDTSGTAIIDEGDHLFSGTLAGKNDKIIQNLVDLLVTLENNDTITMAVKSANSATFEGEILWKELV